jgi:hypothetical protein
MNNEILLLSYWEHFKAAKDLALIYPINHPKRLAIEAELKVLTEKINQP